MNAHTTVPNLYEVELEQGLIGAILRENRLYWSVSELVVPEDFYDSAHQKIWNCIADRMLADQPADVRMLLTRLRPYVEEVKEREKFDLAEYLRGMSMAASSHPNVVAMARAISDLARRRRIVTEASATIDAAYYDRETSPDKIADQAGEAIYEASHRHEAGKGPEPLIDVIRRAASSAEAARLNPEHARITTGLSSVDQKLGGFFPRDLHVLGAASSMGKSGLVAQMALSAARAGYVVLVFSIEMAAEEVATRYLGVDANVPANRITEGRTSELDIQRIAEATQNYCEGKFFLDGSSDLSMAQIRARAQGVRRRHGRVDLIVIDHLRLVRPADPRATEPQQLNQVTKDGKAIAKDLDAAVLFISPVNRELWKRGSARPIIADLYGSSAIEYNADHVWFLHREEYYLESAEPDAAHGEEYTKWLAKFEASKGKAEVFSAKRRGGPKGSVTLNFNAPLVQFTEIDDQPPAQERMF